MVIFFFPPVAFFFYLFRLTLGLSCACVLITLAGWSAGIFCHPSPCTNVGGVSIRSKKRCSVSKGTRGQCYGQMTEASNKSLRPPPTLKVSSCIVCVHLPRVICTWLSYSFLAWAGRVFVFVFRCPVSLILHRYTPPLLASLCNLSRTYCCINSTYFFRASSSISLVFRFVSSSLLSLFLVFSSDLCIGVASWVACGVLVLDLSCES